MSNKSFVTTSYIITRGESGGIFVAGEDNVSVLAKLDNYLVVPLERIEDLEGFIASLRINTNQAAYATAEYAA